MFIVHSSSYSDDDVDDVNDYQPVYRKSYFWSSFYKIRVSSGNLKLYIFIIKLKLKMEESGAYS